MAKGIPEPPPIGETALRPGTFDGQTVLVTGAGTGLGKAIACEFARLGAAIAILSRKAEHLDAGRAAIEATGARIFTTACDIREPDQIRAAFDAVTEALGLPDVLVNNAAANFPVPAEDMSPNAWRTVVDALPFDTRHARALAYGSRLLIVSTNNTEGRIRIALVDPGVPAAPAVDAR